MPEMPEMPEMQEVWERAFPPDLRASAIVVEPQEARGSQQAAAPAEETDQATDANAPDGAAEKAPVLGEQALELGSDARRSAIVLHLSSLPGPFGTGVMGQEAIDFASKLSASRTAYWQILPLFLPLVDSPYDTISTFAGNTRLIDPRGLVTLGLLEEEEVQQFTYPGSAHSVDFDFVYKNSENYLKLAYSRIGGRERQAISAYLDAAHWLRDYAAFRVLHQKHADLSWWDWPAEDRVYSAERVREVEHEAPELFYFHAFVQWVFALQWRALRDACHELGVGILGDIPYYVAADSVDTWSHPQFFQLNEDDSPAWVAGVPPDYFAEDGQLWGYTCYDWEAMAQDDYGWWVRRLEGALDIYDALRLDHFRGFESYWRVAAGSENARVGTWEKGPGMKLFERFMTRHKNLPIIAEDLGELTPAVHELVEQSGFPGMKVLQFAFSAKADNQDQPHHFASNSCVYTGTHDNDTLLGWVWSMEPDERDYVLDYIGFPADGDWGRGGVDSPFCHAMIRLAWSSVARLAACPFQDLMGYGTDTRLNIPGVATGMWRYRASEDAIRSFPVETLRRMNELYGRDGGYRVTEDQAEMESGEREEQEETQEGEGG